MIGLALEPEVTAEYADDEFYAFSILPEKIIETGSRRHRRPHFHCIVAGCRAFQVYQVFYIKLGVLEKSSKSRGSAVIKGKDADIPVIYLAFEGSQVFNDDGHVILAGGAVIIFKALAFSSSQGVKAEYGHSIFCKIPGIRKEGLGILASWRGNDNDRKGARPLAGHEEIALQHVTA